MQQEELQRAPVQKLIGLDTSSSWVLQSTVLGRAHSAVKGGFCYRGQLKTDLAVRGYVGSANQP